MIPRHLARYIKKYAKEYPIVALVGPRQSGKTTLIKQLFPHHEYVSLENLDDRQLASSDPRRFLSDYGPKVILDEVQRVPELFSYLQELADNAKENGGYILTGSSQFLLMENISQSLAGRIVTFKLYPLSFVEMMQYDEDPDFESIFLQAYKERKKINQEELYTILWKGFYPKIHGEKIDSYKWYENYLFTYVERDVRSLINVKNIRLFEQFLQLCASMSGNLLNYASLSNALAVSVPTIKQWISILETSGIIFILRPHFNNFSKRIVKTPKLYFVDTGLLCYLLSIRKKQQLKTHPLLGSIFETFIVGECFKRMYNIGETPPLYFWRDQTGLEIDLIIDQGIKKVPIEIKLAQTWHSDFDRTIRKWLALKGNDAKQGLVLYCGKDIVNLKERAVSVPWYFL
jgi:uncharacterized protein